MRGVSGLLERRVPCQMGPGDASGRPAKFQVLSPQWGPSVARLPNFWGASSKVGQPKVGQKSWAGQKKVGQLELKSPGSGGLILDVAGRQETCKNGGKRRCAS